MYILYLTYNSKICTAKEVLVKMLYHVPIEPSHLPKLLETNVVTPDMMHKHFTFRLRQAGGLEVPLSQYRRNGRHFSFLVTPKNHSKDINVTNSLISVSEN